MNPLEKTPVLDVIGINLHSARMLFLDCSTSYSNCGILPASALDQVEASLNSLCQK